ncbi:MAG: GIY-YIG nuclease family protein [Planctomycetes bacterium]|nr:GIY-YIG nuclease family protein [Planctomycetota bacterium]
MAICESGCCYVYLLRSEADGDYYIGQTADERLRQHNAGEVRSTRSRRPLRLVGYEVMADRRRARWLEYELKHHSDKKRAFIRRLAQQHRSGKSLRLGEGKAPGRVKNEKRRATNYR